MYQQWSYNEQVPRLSCTVDISLSISALEGMAFGMEHKPIVRVSMGEAEHGK